nr:uncharacterized protein CI109_005693 [Kwoniella shandongensis]KAA5525946.1 hypothetical protein CI109_005693 [Kwoniella shandongensis]
MVFLSPTIYTTLLVALFPLGSIATRKITVDNQCSGSLYIAVGSTGGKQVALDAAAGGQPAGWEQKVGKYTFGVTDDWVGGRVWARTGCTPTSDGKLTCIVGQCTDGSLECDGTYGQPGATLAEFNMGGWNGQDFTDENGTSGALVSSDQANNPACCQQNAAAVGAVSCPNTYVPYYNAYKQMCKNAYVYPQDDLYPDTVQSCSNTSEYTITFCPGGKGAGLNPPPATEAKMQDVTGGENAANVQNGAATAAAAAFAIATGTPVVGSGSGDASGQTESATLVVSQSTMATGAPVVGSGTASSVSLTASPSVSPLETGVAGSGEETLEISSSNVPSTPTDPGGVTNTYTSNGAVYMEEIKTSVVTVTAGAQVLGRDVGCMKGKRWMGAREVEC